MLLCYEYRFLTLFDNSSRNSVLVCPFQHPFIRISLGMVPIWSFCKKRMLMALRQVIDTSRCRFVVILFNLLCLPNRRCHTASLCGANMDSVVRVQIKSPALVWRVLSRLLMPYRYLRRSRLWLNLTRGGKLVRRHHQNALWLILTSCYECNDRNNSKMLRWVQQ